MSCLTVLKVENLRLATSNGTVLVDGLDLVLRRGKTTALIGESGSGKSLTAMSILGLLPPGVRQIGGSMTMTVGCETAPSVPQVWKLPHPKARGAQIGLIMQNPGGCFDPLFSIRSHFVETLKAHGIKPTSKMSGKMSGKMIGKTLDKTLGIATGRDAFLGKLLNDVGLLDTERVLDSYPFQLSGGMLQRVMIALSLLPDPPILLADEPFSSLDQAGQTQLMDLLLRLQAQRNFAMLFISHDIGCAMRMAQHVMVMRAGKIVEHGPVSQVMEAPACAYTQELIKAHRELEGSDCLPCQGGQHD